ncbi:MAG: carbohydrate ABC transporter permease [Firmicutes bacterium]|nr:carbohydrate ABC transporter permease [Bacillota bacterium]
MTAFMGSDFRFGLRLSRGVILLVLCLVAVIMLYPFYYMLHAAFQSFQQFELGRGFSFTSWAQLFSVLPVFRELVNSSIVTLGTVAIILAVSTCGGYSLSKLRFRGSSVVFVGIVATMMVPLQSIIIPEYVNLSRVGLIGHFIGAVLVYSALGSPFATFLMTTYFRGVPDELLEAAVVDGLSYANIFLRIMVPMAIPALFTVAVLQFIQVWDDLLVAMLFLPNPDVRTITVGLATLQAQRIVNIPVLMAGSFISALPAVIVYLIFQRSLINGLTMGMGK